MDTSTMILELSQATGIVGMEAGAVKTAEKMLEGCGDCSVSALGSLICRVKTAPADKPHIMLTAHIDEIGLVVTYIDEKGFLRVSGCGGIDLGIILAAQVLVHTKQGDLPGVVCTVPPHLQPDDTKLPKVEDICIDVGLSQEQAKQKITLGDRVSFVNKAGRMLNGQVSGKAIDDRGGCASVILAARELAKCDLNCSLTVMLSTLEEIGSQGAKTAAEEIMPTHAIVVDVAFGHTPDAPRHQCGELGKGAMIGVAPVLDNDMSRQLVETAKKHKIPYQMDVQGGRTGTDSDEVAVCGAGVRTALVSIPQKFMHTPIETVMVSDVEAVGKLMALYIKDIFGGER